MWMAPQQSQRRPGTEGVIIVLLDVTGSIEQADYKLASKAVADVIQDHPNVRFFAWADRITEIRLSRGRPPAIETLRAKVGGWNNLAGALTAISPLNPDKTIVISDGGEADEGACPRCLGIVDRMTGAIDAFYSTTYYDEPLLPWTHSPGVSFMAELARRGGGRLAMFKHWRNPSASWGERFRAEILESIRALRIRRFHHQCLPDMHIQLGRRG